MNSFLNFIYQALIIAGFWFLIPLIMAWLIFMSIRIAYRVAGEYNKISARYGVNTGFGIFLIFFFFNIPSLKGFESLQNIIAIPKLWYIGIGILVGFLLWWVLRLSVYTKLVGFVTLLLVSAGLIFLYSYFFIRIFNDFLISINIGIIIGIWLFIIIKPESLKDIFGPIEQHKH